MSGWFWALYIENGILTTALVWWLIHIGGGLEDENERVLFFAKGAPFITLLWPVVLFGIGAWAIVHFVSNQSEADA